MQKMQINNLNYENFNNLDLLIEDKRFISIIGPNNSGKTTLFRIMTGIIPTSNVVSIDNTLLNRQNVNKYVKQLGVVFKYLDNMFLFDTVYEEMSYSLKNLGYCTSYINRRINSVLSLFSVSIIDKKIKDLTDYEKQVLLICIALLHKPKFLLLDDIFLNMNSKDSLFIINILKNIKNLSIINFTSRLDYLNESDYIYVLDNHKIKLEGSYQEIINNSNILVRIGLELPLALNLSVKLNESGLIDKNYENLEDLVNNIWR